MEYPSALPYDIYDDCADQADKTWILKDLIALGEDSTWFGPPGSLKSALLLDMAVSIGFRKAWRGHEYHCKKCYDDPYDEPRGTVYFALERADLVKNRIGAYKMRDPFPLPIAVVSEKLDLLDPDCVFQVRDTVWDFEKKWGCPVGLIIIDTFSKAIANGDEDKAQTQNIAANNLIEIHGYLSGVHIATIGHTGKNPNAGERGSNARLGHVDLAVQISGDKVRTAKVVKANDQPERQIASFEAEQITVSGKRKDGTDRTPYTTAILAAHTPAMPPKPHSRPSAKQAQALDALKRAIAERGQDGGVHAEYWKEELTKVGRIKADDKNDRTTFRRIQDSVSQHISELDGIVRIVPQPPPSPL